MSTGYLHGVDNSTACVGNLSIISTIIIRGKNCEDGSNLQWRDRILRVRYVGQNWTIIIVVCYVDLRTENFQLNGFILAHGKQ